LEDYGVPGVHCEVDCYLVRYVSTDFDGSSAENISQLFVPGIDTRTDRPFYGS